MINKDCEYLNYKNYLLELVAAAKIIIIIYLNKGINLILVQLYYSRLVKNKCVIVRLTINRIETWDFLSFFLMLHSRQIKKKSIEAIFHALQQDIFFPFYLLKMSQSFNTINNKIIDCCYKSVCSWEEKSKSKCYQHETQNISSYFLPAQL